MDLNAYYEKWDKMTNTSENSNAAPTLTKADLEGVKFTVGKPLTEEEFKAYRSKCPNTRILHSTSR